MADAKNEKTSQPHNTVPFPGGAPGPDAFRKLMDEQVARLRDFASEMEKLQATALDQARQVIDETARLYKESLNYGGLMMSEWRRMAIDATRQAVDTFDAAMPAPGRPGARS